MHNELQDVMGQSFGVPDDIDEDDLMGELDALEDELAQESEHTSASGVPSYLQVTNDIWLSEIFHSIFCFALCGLTRMLHMPPCAERCSVSAFFLPQYLIIGLLCNVSEGHMLLVLPSSCLLTPLKPILHSPDMQNTHWH